MPEFNTFTSYSSLNDYRISNDLYNTNLAEISRDIKCFQSSLSLDSGFGTLSRPTSVNQVDLSLDITSIRLETVSKYASNLGTKLYMKSLLYCYNLLNISMTNLPFLLKTSVNHNVSSKRTFASKLCLFSPLFISKMRGKSLLKKIEQKQEDDSKLKVISEDSKQISVIMVNENKSNIDSKNVALGVRTMRSLFSKIYDVNFF